MKKIMKKLMKNFVPGLILFVFMLIAGTSMAQAPPPPPPPGSHGSGTNQSPMGAPLDGGLTVFLAFAALYAGKEWRKNKE